MTNLMDQLKKEHIEKSGKKVPAFKAGDTLKVMCRLVETDGKERLQAFEGVCISRNDHNKMFTVRKISFGEGVERVFPLFSPRLDSIELVRRGTTRRAKLYYLRGRRGKSARIAERMDAAAGHAPQSAIKGARFGNFGIDDFK